MTRKPDGTAVRSAGVAARFAARVVAAHLPAVLAPAALVLALLVLAMLPSACAGPAAKADADGDGVAIDETLRPPEFPRQPGAAPEPGAVHESVDLSTCDLASLFPRRSLQQRSAFVAACDVSRSGASRAIATDVKALSDAFWSAKDAADFERLVRAGFVATRVSAPQPADGASTQAASGSAGVAPAALLTGYATPVVRVRREPDDRFRFPFFGDLRLARPELAEASRAEILASASARADAIAWIDDPLGWALVETNGTATLVVDEPEAPRQEFHISRVATNGRPFRSVGRGLADAGLIDAATATLADVARIAERDPAAIEKAALANERLVFFAEVSRDLFPPALGLAAGRLVGGYSCAADQKYHPPGSMLLVAERATRGAARRPVRLLFVHDAGGAIAGPERVDLYFGQGTEAILRAGDLRVEVDVMRLSARTEDESRDAEAP